MKKVIFIFLLCLFAGVTKSYAVNWNGSGFQFGPWDNQQVVYPIQGSNLYGTFTMNAYMWPTQNYYWDEQLEEYQWGLDPNTMSDYGCNLNIVNINNYPMITYGSIIYGPYNGTQYANAPSFQSITVSDTEYARIYIRTEYCGGSVWFVW